MEVFLLLKTEVVGNATLKTDFITNSKTKKSSIRKLMHSNDNTTATFGSDISELRPAVETIGQSTIHKYLLVIVKYATVDGTFVLLRRRREYF